MSIILWIGLFASATGPAETPGPPSWSPDGRWLAYVQEARSRPRPLKPGWLFRDENGDVEVFAAGKPTAYRLWATRPDTGESVLLEDSASPLSSPSWNREGTGLAYSRIVLGTKPDAGNSWEVVLQDGLERRRVLRKDPFLGAIPSRIGGLAPCWSSDGKMLALPRPGMPGLVIIRADNGRVLKTLEGAIKPQWSPIENRLAYVTGGPSPALWVLDGVLAEPRRLAIHSSEIDVLPGPVWSRDGHTLMTLRRSRSRSVPGGLDRGDSTFELLRYRVDGSGIDTPVDLIHDNLADEGKVSGVWFVVGPDGRDAFYATASIGQMMTQMTWGTGKFSEAMKRFNPFDDVAWLGEFAVSPAGGSLALRVGSQGSWSPPAVCDPETLAMILLVPDDDTRAEWLARILEIMIPLLREDIPVPTLTDGTSLVRPSLLPVPGELEDGDSVGSRLRRLARMGMKLLGPPSAETDEVRLTLAYLAGESRDASLAADRMMTRAAGPDERLRLLSIQAQIMLMRRDFDRAKPLMTYLRDSSFGPSREIEEGPIGHRLMPVESEGSIWPSFLMERAELLRKSSTEGSADLVPRGVLNLDRPLLPAFMPEIAPPAPVPFL